MKLYTVAMPGGTKDLEYEAYVRLLNKSGIDVTDVPRILERGAPNRWLYAWEQKGQAEKFAKQLREETRDKRWQLHEISATRIPRGPLGPVQIEVSSQRDGYTYGLHPHSQELVEKKFPKARLISSVFIGKGTEGDFAKDRPEAIWDHVAMILTGLNLDELEELGGYRVSDPVSGKILREPEVPATPALGRRQC